VLWLREGDDVCARTKLRASGGDGLVLVRSEDDHGTLPDAQLYTKYVPKKDEYRVHVCGEEIIGIQRKAARKEFDGTVNWQVRSHDNGFVFLHIPPEEWSTVPADVLLQSELAFTHMGLDFGAVDVIWNNKRKKAYVLEINSAPGLEGHTIQIYKNGLERLIQNKQRPAR
jgi:glutathione synthase/RimK-type ligase-like ATP-grasp enzyme